MSAQLIEASAPSVLPEEVLTIIDTLPPVELLGAALSMYGSVRFVRPSAGMSMEERITGFTSDVEKCLPTIFFGTHGAAWRTCYAVLVEFENGGLSFIDVDTADHLYENGTSGQFNEMGVRFFGFFVEMQSKVPHWSARIDAHRKARIASGKEDWPWRSAVIVFAARAGDRFAVASTARIYPEQTALSTDTEIGGAWDEIRGHL